MREEDRLDAIAGFELGEYPLDVGLGGGLLDAVPVAIFERSERVIVLGERRQHEHAGAGGRGLRVPAFQRLLARGGPRRVQARGRQQRYPDPFVGA